MTNRNPAVWRFDHRVPIWCAMIAAAIFFWLDPGFAIGALSSVQVIPQPRQIREGRGSFGPIAARVIVTSDDAADRFAARLVQESVLETAGMECRIIASLPKGDHRLWLGENTEIQELAARPTTSPRNDSAQGYSLDVDSDGVLIQSPSDEGLFNGVQTLIQLLEQSQRDTYPLPGISIDDWPTFGWRGEYFDASQYFGTIVTTRAGMEQQIKRMARYKLNCLVIDLYNLVPFKSFPYCADANTLSMKDWNDLVELAHQYHVTLIPSLQSFGQMYPVIWTCDQGKPYREATCGGLICPSRPENVKFLQGLYRDLISVFKYSPIMGIGCSEVGMQWANHYCPLCQARIDHGETYNDIFAKHVRDCDEAVDAAAKEVGRPVRPMMWADEFYLGYNNKRWVGIDMIPHDMIMGHWQYWSRYQGLAVQTNKTYDGISGLLDHGYDCLTVSASFEFNTYLHDLSPDQPTDGKPDFLLDAGIINIADQAHWMDVHNRESPHNKVLGGVCATFSQHDIRCWDTEWFAYALQADYTWGDPSRPLKDSLNTFTHNFVATFYQPTDDNTANILASAYRDLDSVKNDIERNNHLIRDVIGEYDIHDDDYLHNDLADSLKHIDDLTAHPQAAGNTIADIRARCDHGIQVAANYQQQLARISGRVRNESSLHYLISATHKIENHFQRTLFLLDLADALQKLAAANDKSTMQPEMAKLQSTCTVLRRDTQNITDETDELTTTDGAGYHKVLASLDAFQKQLDALEKNTDEHR